MEYLVMSKSKKVDSKLYESSKVQEYVDDLELITFNELQPIDKESAEKIKDEFETLSMNLFFTFHKFTQRLNKCIHKIVKSNPRLDKKFESLKQSGEFWN